MAKALPAPVDQFLKGTPYDTHRDFAASSSSSSSQSFRTPTSSSSFNPAQDEDLGRFARGPSRPDYSHPVNLLQGKGKQVESSPRDYQDGGDVMALLSFGNLTEGVHGDWETSLLSEQQSAFQQDLTRHLPYDPEPSSHSRSRSEVKGKSRASPPSSGNHSPTSSALLSTLNSLDIASMKYLSSLLAKDEKEAIQDYLSLGTYTDDVWTVPEGARRVLEKVSGGGVDGGSGKEKALERLRMVMRHLRGENVAAEDVQDSKSRDVDVRAATSPSNRDLDKDMRGGFESPWAEEYENSITAMHAHSSSRTRHSTDSSLAPTPTQTHSLDYQPSFPTSAEAYRFGGSNQASTHSNGYYESDAAASTYTAPLSEQSITSQYSANDLATATATATATSQTQISTQTQPQRSRLLSFSEVEASQSGFPSDQHREQPQDFHQRGTGASFPPKKGDGGMGEGAKEEEEEEKEDEEDLPPFQQFMMQRLVQMRRKSFDGGRPGGG